VLLTKVKLQKCEHISYYHSHSPRCGRRSGLLCMAVMSLSLQTSAHLQTGIGSLRNADVSRTITAPAVLAQSQAPMVIVQENNDLRETLARLNERLNEPFVTVNTVTGDLGIKQAQDDYQRLMNNKSPKNKRK